MISIKECPICSGTTFSPFVTCTDHSVSHETFTILKCSTCQLLITSPRPEDSELGKYYLSAAYTSHINQAASLMDKAYVVARSFTLKWKLSLILKHNSNKAGKLLDFGCGVGEFLKASAMKGWQVSGVEPSSIARTNANPVVSKHIVPSVKDLTDQQKKFDVITAWHVLEHVADLNNTLEVLTGLLQPNGTIFIAVPNHNSWDAGHYQEYWAAYDVPRHLWHFTPPSMTKLLTAHSLRVITVLPMRLDAYYVSLLSEKYKNSSSLPRLVNAALNGVRSNYSAKSTGQYSSLVYIAKR